MKCKSCESEMVRLVKGHYFCEKCHEIFKIEGEKFSPIKDKKKFYDNILTDFENFSKNIKSILEKFIEPEKKDDDEEGYFI